MFNINNEHFDPLGFIYRGYLCIYQKCCEVKINQY